MLDGVLMQHASGGPRDGNFFSDSIERPSCDPSQSLDQRRMAWKGDTGTPAMNHNAGYNDLATLVAVCLVPCVLLVVKWVRNVLAKAIGKCTTQGHRRRKRRRQTPGRDYVSSRSTDRKMSRRAGHNGRCMTPFLLHLLYAFGAVCPLLWSYFSCPYPHDARHDVGDNGRWRD